MNIENLKQSLIHRLNLLKDEYPDCDWLKECLEMNQKFDRAPQMVLVPKVSSYNLTISRN